MNIFCVYECPVESAKALPDNLVNKMLQEQIQLLSVAHHELDGVVRGTKPSHKNHPCAVFARESKANYKWVLDHATALMEEYTYRTGKVHGYKKYYDQVKEFPANLKSEEFTYFRNCVDDKYKKTLDTHENYRVYLANKIKDWAERTEKRPIIARWTKRSKPEFYNI